MRQVVTAIVFFAAFFVKSSAAPVAPFEKETWTTPANGVDIRVSVTLKQRGLEPAYPCSDEVFCRRVYLDIIGTLPEPDAVSRFLADEQPDKRSRLIDELLTKDEFADYWTLKWCDLLRVKAEFPINLWPNAVQAYHRWVRQTVKENRPYGEFVRDLLTSSGSNFRVPPVNFYRAVQNREPAGLAEAVALTFMGVRFGKWPEDRRNEMAAFFSRVAFKSTDEWKEQIVLNDPAAKKPVTAVFPDGVRVQIEAGTDPRIVFADWLITTENPWFARNIVNRIWSWLFGRGIIHEPDDIRLDNPPVNPELLSFLEAELVHADFDLQHIFRLILNSRTYQQSAIARAQAPAAEAVFACYPIRRLDAEVLIDALIWIGGRKEIYESRIPEPFTWIPEEQRTIALTDGSITSTFLQMFGRPPRDTGLEAERNNDITDAQRLFILNSTDVYRRITNSLRLRRIVISADSDRHRLIRDTYMTLLSRQPTPDEIENAYAYWQTPNSNSSQAPIDLAWTLVNSMEFLYRH